MTSTESKKVSLEQISSLREATGAGILLCKEALAETNGNQRNATSFKHDVLHSACQPSVFRRWDSHGTAPKSWQTG